MNDKIILNDKIIIRSKEPMRYNLTENQMKSLIGTSLLYNNNPNEKIGKVIDVWLDNDNNMHYKAEIDKDIDINKDMNIQLNFERPIISMNFRESKVEISESDIYQNLHEDLVIKCNGDYEDKKNYIMELIKKDND